MHILFLAHTPNVRLLRQAIALRETGRHRLDLMYNNAISPVKYGYRLIAGGLQGSLYRNRRMDQALLERTFDHILTYRNEEQLRRLIREASPDLIHGHAEPNRDVQIAIESARTPVIFDPTDLTSIRFFDGEAEPVEIAAEAFCFANADGYIHKGPEVDYALNRYEFTGPVLHFDNYCLPQWIVSMSSNNRVEGSNTWHTTFTGGIAPLFVSRDGWGYKQFDDLGKIFGRQKIHLHLYGSPFHNAFSLASYKIEAARNPFLHLHKSLSPDGIAAEVSQYDLGIWAHDFSHEKNMSSLMAETSIGNKFYSYLEAGLPMIVNAELIYGASMVRKYGVGFVFEYERFTDIRAVLESTDFKAIQQNIASARHELNMDRQIKRLESYYQALI